MANPAALKTAFDAATSRNEWATALVVAGLIVEFLALLFFSKEMPRKEKVALVVGSIMVAVGVGGEYVFGGRAVSAAKALQQASDERIAELKGAQEADHKIAAQAARSAALLGVSVGNLQGFVSKREREIAATFAQFKTFAAEEKKRMESVIADLSADRAQIDKARNDAAASVEAAKKLVVEAKATILEQRVALANIRGQLSDLSARAIVTEAAIAPRVIGQKDAVRLQSVLKPFQGQMYVGMIPDSSHDERPLWAMLDKILQDAAWKRDAVDFPWGKSPAATGIDLNPGVTVEVQKKADARTTDAALALVEALNSGPRLNARVSSDPDAQMSLRPGDIAIVIGPKPE
jgi:hypothetical protein